MPVVLRTVARKLQLLSSYYQDMTTGRIQCKHTN